LVGVALGTRALALVGEFVVHTERTKVSPDGEWALVIDTYDEGALGGSTSVYLEPPGSEDRAYTLHEPDWLPDWAVRWLDARTIMLDGRLEMPFVQLSIDTGSPATSGAAVDATGYVRNEVAPDDRVAMLSGLSLIAPRSAKAVILTLRESVDGRPRQELRPAAGSSWPGSLRCSVLAASRRSELPDPRIATAGRVVPTSLGKRIEVRWDARSDRLIILTRLRGRLIGLLWLRDAGLQSGAEAARRAEAVWRLFQVERIPPG
jgi:hypothetical protein